jgi:wyosine [tRNA(Phe)-imidazoG37] synthetase (radical SAM superfamily)
MKHPPRQSLHHPAMAHPLVSQHQRTFQQSRFVYPVLSRRAGGLSVGVNLNPDKACNFNCVYCQVDRTTQSETRFVELEPLLEELRKTLRMVQDGTLFDSDKFRQTPADLRTLHDIAFSGDGEPTTYKNFDDIIDACAAVKRSAGLERVKMVLITNASQLHRPHVVRGLKLLDENQGEIWAKLDAGTESYYRQIARSPIPFEQIMRNITRTAACRPLVIQSLFLQMGGEPPRSDQIEAYCQRLLDILAAGGQLSLVQIYTIARRPAELNVAPLSDAQLGEIGKIVQQRTKLPISVYGG